MYNKTDSLHLCFGDDNVLVLKKVANTVLVNLARRLAFPTPRTLLQCQCMNGHYAVVEEKFKLKQNLNI